MPKIESGGEHADVCDLSRALMNGRTSAISRVFSAAGDDETTSFSHFKMTDAHLLSNPLSYNINTARLPSD